MIEFVVHPETILHDIVRAANARFMSKVVVDDNGCWLWSAGIAQNGYGVFWAAGRSRPAHRFAYEAEHGRVPPGLVLDHVCRVRRCVNPAHLEPVSPRENTRRGEGPAAKNARKRSCDLGHPLSGDNLVIDKAGHRQCRTCRNDNARVRNRERFLLYGRRRGPG